MYKNSQSTNSIINFLFFWYWITLLQWKMKILKDIMHIKVNLFLLCVSYSCLLKFNRKIHVTINQWNQTFFTSKKCIILDNRISSSIVYLFQLYLTISDIWYKLHSSYFLYRLKIIVFARKKNKSFTLIIKFKLMIKSISYILIFWYLWSFTLLLA